MPGNLVPSVVLKQVVTLSGQEIGRCYQCEKCSVGCPVADFSDLLPHQVAQLLALGHVPQVLASSMVWLCVGCETCGQRCPNQINLRPVMDALKHLTKVYGIAPREKGIVAFHRSFLDDVKAHGRVHEATMLAAYKVRSGDLFSDLALGMKLFSKSKIPLRPRKGADAQEVQGLFQKASGHPSESVGE